MIKHYKIAWFYEGLGGGQKVYRNHPNMRNDVSTQCVLNVDLYNLNEIPPQQYDLGIIVIPKKNPTFNIEPLKQKCKKLAYFQEGPHTLFQDYDLATQIWYYNTLMQFNFIFAHNENDVKYFRGLTNKPCYVMPTLMLDSTIQNLPKETRSNVMINGNMTSWYSAFDSMVIAQEYGQEIWAPSMGRKLQNEDQLEELNHIPFVPWPQWINVLNGFSLGINLMRVWAAGTFSLNCSYLGIPCVGYKGLDTQEKLHPSLSVDLGDLESARNLVKKLKMDIEFYNQCSQETRELYKTSLYNETNFIPYIEEILKTEL